MFNSTFIKSFSLTAGIINLLSLSGLAFAHPAQAESIKFSTWNSSGDVTTPSDGAANISNSSFGDGNDFDYNPSHPDAYNYTQSNPSIDAGGSLENFLGLNVGDLDINGMAFQGSAISTTLKVAAGEKLNFKWNFLTNETASLPPFTPLNDFAFFTVNGEIFKLADVNDASNISSFFNSETGDRTFSYTFTKSSIYKVGIGVVDIDDFTNTSALQIREASLTSVIQSVPEPSVALGCCLVIGFGTIFQRKRSKTSSNKRVIPILYEDAQNKTLETPCQTKKLFYAASHKFGISLKTIRLG
jgi:hypothetical protein